MGFAVSLPGLNVVIVENQVRWKEATKIIEQTDLVRLWSDILPYPEVIEEISSVGLDAHKNWSDTSRSIIQVNLRTRRFH